MRYSPTGRVVGLDVAVVALEAGAARSVSLARVPAPAELEGRQRQGRRLVVDDDDVGSGGGQLDWAPDGAVGTVLPCRPR